MISAEELNRWDLPPVPGGEGLNHAPEDPVVIRTRLAALFGVPVECVTIAPSIGAAQIAPYEEFGELQPLYSPHQLGSAIWAERIGERPIIIIESQLEFLEGADRSYVAQAASEPGFFVIRTLEAYGISAGQMVAIIHVKEHRRAIRVGLRLERPSTPLQRAVETVLHPSRMRLIEQRIGGIRAERKRVATGLGIAVPFANFITLRSPDPIALARHGIRGNWFKDAEGQQTGDVEVPLGTPEENDRLLAAMGVPVPPRPPVRRAEVVRDTKETRIVATVDLDRAEPVAIATGIGFYDHMLEQVARHGGFACTLACEGDLHIEAHHTIEDSALALGEALRQALGDRRGVARFGFVAPLDEAEAAVTLDLSGRPFVKFEGAFARPMIGDYPTEMTSHVFRSLADAMRATIHVRVTGEDDHHKTEAAFKSFGRALRQAIRIEGDAVPSTKGVLG